MRWHPPGSHVPRVIVWQLFTIGTGRKRAWSWLAKSRNGRLLAVSEEKFGGREQALQAAIFFGRPDSHREYNRITVFHDGHELILNWGND